MSASTATSGLPPEEIEKKVALIQTSIPLGLHAVGEALKAEVVAPAWSAGGSNRVRATLSTGRSRLCCRDETYRPIYDWAGGTGGKAVGVGGIKEFWLIVLPDAVARRSGGES